MKNNRSPFDSSPDPVALTGRQFSQPESHSTPSSADIVLSESLLAKIGTELWRLKLKLEKMVRPGTGEMIDEARRAYRHLQASWEALTDAGIEIQDHTGQPYNAGLSLKTIAYQPVASISSETVIETIKPTIYYRQEPIQQGEVIVGYPES